MTQTISYVKNINFNKIENLAAFGCSFTYGNELKDSSKSSWVVVLGKLLKISNISNFGISGINTEAINLLTLEYIERYKFINSTNPSKAFIIVMLSRFNRKFTILYNDSIMLYTFMRINMYRFPGLRYLYSYFSNLWFPKRISIKSYRNIFTNFYNLTCFNCFNNFKRQVKLIDAYLKQSGHPYAIVPCDRRYDFIGNDIEGYVDEFTTSRGYQIGEDGHPLEEGNYAYAQYLYEKLTNESR